MKKLLLVLALCFVGSLKAQETIWYNVSTNLTNVAATSTNSTAGAITIINNPKDTVRIYVTAVGTAATTNGSLVVKFSTASGSWSTTNEFDTASSSAIKITMSNSFGATTNTQSDWFQVRGVRYIRVGQIENNYQGPVSNLTFRVSTVAGGQQ